MALIHTHHGEPDEEILIEVDDTESQSYYAAEPIEIEVDPAEAEEELVEEEYY